MVCLCGCTFRQEAPPLAFTVESLTAASLRVAAVAGWARYEWTFGDGTQAEGRTANHTYSAPGEHTINLKAVDAEGSASYANQIVTVRRDIYVSEDRSFPRDYVTIQLAIEAAEPGDMILIEGEHVENVTVDKPITLRGPCTLISVTAAPAVHITADGVTLEKIAFEGGGDEATAGGALRITSADPVVTECTFDNHSGGSGGAVYVMESGVLFSACVFTRNQADIDGGAVYCEGDRAFPTFVECRFSDNRANAGGGIAIRPTTVVEPDATPLRVEECVFQRNEAAGTQAGGAIHIGHSCSAVLGSNTFTANGPLDVAEE